MERLNQSLRAGRRKLAYSTVTAGPDLNVTLGTVKLEERTAHLQYSKRRTLFVIRA
jgi:hypothetical protein